MGVLKCHSEYLFHEIAEAQPGLWESFNVLSTVSRVSVKYRLTVPPTTELHFLLSFFSLLSVEKEGEFNERRVLLNEYSVFRNF